MAAAPSWACQRRRAVLLSYVTLIGTCSVVKAGADAPRAFRIRDGGGAGLDWAAWLLPAALLLLPLLLLLLGCAASCTIAAGHLLRLLFQETSLISKQL